MAPKKAKAAKRDQKHGGKNGKKEGLSGSSFFTWFMVIALLGVWTSVAVVWFDLVDYEEFLAKAKDFRYNLSEALQGKLGDYDADGDGDFDVDDAKVLLGLKERFVSEKTSEDLDDTDSLLSDISDADLEDIIKEPQPLDDDIFDLEDALDDHETQDVSDFSLEDAVEPSVHGSLSSEPDVKDEEEPVVEEHVHVEEPAVEEEVIEEVLAEEPAASPDDYNVEETLPHEDEQEEYEEQELVYEQEFEEAETEFLNAPTPETEEPVDEDVEHEAEPFTGEEPAPVADEKPEAEEQELQGEDFEDQEPEVPGNQEPEHRKISVLLKDDDDMEEVNDYSHQIELEDEEPAELSDEPDGAAVYEQTEESAPETSETDEYTIEATEDVIDDSEEMNDIHLEDEPSELAEDQNEEPESPHEHIEVEQYEIPENPVVDDRPSERAEEHYKDTSEGQQRGHADT